ncbi:probable leucine--tRNA ligase, cytosolic [Fusarium fujikuroi IMI 58289]|uniref:leucine--tRNA ligase n=1 Tax=Gibberella fujikuroi (strain CBS 195.34 / IMI 58289 / NRRL A-6831) TaxID=1279085 RepID=S0DWU2_GIBF5|nr:probable leucine--tRNA ligase, cytosolic [Fusarium fujikuroi IMI 58289]CCT67024.1 probable leucine--tRNA ligase, cytosolic [Fusarium fujikuroi IMI 58289]SCN95670.1 probable leucine--tRNA ligase, cytosolic [Fusarium fujikuroi]SCO40695.1 probable leucine--tRNA ligase, cytosolic [Fusarium fujikuroi]
MASTDSVPKAMEALNISKTKELKGAGPTSSTTEKRDTLIALEKKYQQKWQDEKVFEANAPTTDEVPLHSIPAAELREQQPKFFGTMAYPYMNGTLHAGHSFSVSKVEFAAGVARMQGKRTLFPMGFHCTGMPIKACADKLVDEVKMFGQDFSGYKDDEPVVEEKAPIAKQTKEDITKFKATKGKAAAKAVKMKYQFQIMQAIGIPAEEIHKFADPQHWLQYFPPLCREDLTNFGCRIDWRRSFVTTDANPYYDAFVRWQMNSLRALNKIKFGKRYTIYSIKDGQPCMDHDRAEGEGVGPQEYTALKIKVLEWAPKAAETLKDKLPDGVNVYQIAATLRPETMYGQTCCFVGPKITYGIFKVNESDYYCMTERAARNMAYQGIFAKEGVIEKVAEIIGSDMVGTLVDAPLSLHKEGVRVLPMETVLPTKGTGVVTSVPSDSPDDFATVSDLAKKADYYGIQKEWAELEIFPIIETPTYGDLCAPFLVKKLKIASPKDTKQLEEAKELAYKEGFYQGVLKVGEFKGEKVEVAKPKVRQQMIDAGQAFAYSEPERKVVSRSADECIVSLMDQWYLDYGEESWKKTALDYVDNGLNTYTPEVKNSFEGVLNWLNQWACARSFGLGSKLPWDPQFLVESLSDSTVYMAYYTIAHLLHKDIFGKTKGSANVEPEQMIDEVWDYIFCRRDLSDEIVTGSKIPKETLEKMRREFEYFYPLDVRVSGKDLINNHLVFSLYSHLALFSQEYWPRSIRANGHLMLNGEKMSKSTGNFMTLRDLTEKYGADASRIALADAGDGVNDANFEEDVADTNILRLYTLKEWCEDIVRDQDQLRTGELNSFQDALFNNDMNAVIKEAVEQYANTNYKLALKAGLYELTSARDFYREACAAAGIKLHRDLALRYIEVQALLLAVVAPHWSEYIWLEVLKNKGTIHNARFPEIREVDASLSAKRDYVRTTASNVNSAEGLQLKKKAKGKETSFDPKKPKQLTIFVTDKFPAWQAKYIDLLKEMWNVEAKSVNDKELNGKIGKMGEMKKAMPFVQNLKRRLQAGEPASVVLEQKLAFNEKETLLQMVPGLKRTSGLVACHIISVEEGSKKGFNLGDGKEVELSVPTAEHAVPGQPTFHFENVEA